MRVAYFDCFSGISGDMTIGAFLDAGLKLAGLKKELSKLKVKGYSIKKSFVRRGALTGTKFDCIVGKAAHDHRSLKEIITLIDRSQLGERVKTIARAIFMNMGKAEAKVHGIGEGRDVRLHELGAIDSIVDIVGTAIAIDLLGIDEVRSSNITLGRTFARSAHGVLPIPAPATLELLKGVPVGISEVPAELVTPTGAGIVKTLARAFGPMPDMKISGVGYGAGTRELIDRPNFLRLVIGEAGDAFKTDKVFVIEANIDDMNPQIFEHVFERLFASGALDVYISTIQMKKSRPAFKLTVLSDEPLVEKLAAIVFKETTTIGVRFYETGRFKLERKSIKVKTRFGAVSVKVSTGPGGIFTATPEYETCVKLARLKNVPLKLIYDEAKKAAGSAK